MHYQQQIIFIITRSLVLRLFISKAAFFKAMVVIEFGSIAQI